MYHTSSALFVFLYCYRDRRDLHSFPTRRSSDLRWRVDEDLEEWTRKGQVFDRVRVELEREIRFAVGCHGERSRGIPFARDRKSTRLNSSHVSISYAVFCLKKKKKKDTS